MKSVLISINPKWVEKIASGEKTIEVRRTAPKEVPFKAYIYCTKAKSQWRYSDYEGAYENSKGEIVYAQQHIIGEFICDKVYNIEPIFSFYDCYSGYDDFSDVSSFDDYSIDDERLKKTCLTRQELYIYGKEKKLYGWHISDLKIYDKPKELSEFGRKCDYASEIHCRDCLILGDWDSCCGVMCKPLTRPPQSYMFVEEVGNVRI